MQTLRVASFNIRNGRALDGLSSWPFRRRSTAAAVRALGADVLGLQEVYRCQLRYLRREVPGYEVAGEGRRGGTSGEWCPLWVGESAWAVEESWTRWFADDPQQPGARLPDAGFPRIATMAVVEGRGLRFGVANVHLDEKVAANRLRSVELLLGWLAEVHLPWLVVGDFNEGPEAPAITAMEAAGYRAAVAPDAPGTAHDFTGRTDGARLDHVLVSDGWMVTSAGVWTGPVAGRLPSDHWPVWADVSLPGGGPQA